MILILLLSFLTAFVLTYFSIPSIIEVAHKKKLFDEPGSRSSHVVSTPSLGGIGIFAGVIFSIVLWTSFEKNPDLQYVLCAFIVMYLIGVRDDILPLSPKYKLLGQLFTSIILVAKSDVLLTGLYGLFGIDYTLPYWIAVLVTIFTILVIINAFNLIDGINGLAGSIGVLVLGALGVWFYLIGQMGYAIMAFSTVGAIMAFLRYNYTPAQIFMGDTGSLLIGLAASILLIKFIDINHNLAVTNQYKFLAGPVVAIGIAIIPLFDTLRVFAARILRGRSPFSPDRRHIHHLLIDYGFSHTKATAILFFVNMIFITVVFFLDDKLEMHILLALLLGIALLGTYWLHKEVVKKQHSTTQTKQEQKKTVLLTKG